MNVFGAGWRVKRAAPRSQRLAVAGAGDNGVHAYGEIAKIDQCNLPHRECKQAQRRGGGGVGHAQRRGGVVVVGAVSVGESVSTGRCDVCAGVTVEGSGQAIC